MGSDTNLIVKTLNNDDEERELLNDDSAYYDISKFAKQWMNA